MADDTQQAIDQLKALPQDRQAAILSQLDPAKKQEILGRLQAKPQSTSIRQSVDDWLQSPEGGLLSRVGRGILRVPVGAAESAYDINKPSDSVLGNLGLATGLTQVKRGLIDPAVEQASQALGGVKQSLKSAMSGNIPEADRALTESVGHTGAAMLPLAGPWAASLGERAGKGDIAGAGAELLTGLALPKIAEKGAPAVADFAREHAAKIDTRYFGNREAGTAVSKAKLVGQLKNLATQIDPETGNSTPGLIRQELEATKAKTAQAVGDAAKAGQTIDFSTELDGMTKQALDTAATRDLATYQKAAQQIKSINLMVRAAVDPQSGGLRPVNVKALSPTDITNYDMNGNATGILKRLEKPSFEGGTTDIAENYAKNLRMALSDKLDEAVPGVKDLRRQSHNLISADIAAKSMLEQNYAGLKRYYHSIWSKGPVDFGAFALLHEGLGLNWYEAAGTVAAARALWDSAPSTTARAAAWRMVSDLLDRGKAATRPVGQTGGTVGPSGPQLPTGGQPNAPAGQPSGGFPGLQVPQNQPLTSAPSATETPAPTPRTTPQLTGTVRTPEGVSGMSAKTKAMMDRVDVLQERIDNPKSAADKTAAVREMDELKKMISGESTGVEEKRLAGRERVAKFRAKQASQATPVEIAGSEPVASSGTPEQTLSAIQQGREYLKTLPGGPEFLTKFNVNVKKAKLSPEQELDGLVEGILQLKGGH